MGKARWKFDRFEVDPREFVVRDEGRPIALEPKPLSLLCYLIEHRDRVVPKEELLEKIWSDVVVGDASLASAVREIRLALGDDARKPRYIETRWRRGYRFIGVLRARRIHAPRPSTPAQRLQHGTPLRPRGALELGLRIAGGIAATFVVICVGYYVLRGDLSLSAPHTAKITLLSPLGPERAPLARARDEERDGRRSTFSGLQQTAYTAFLRGRALSTAPIEIPGQALHHLERAIALDPTLGAPHSWLADAYRRSAMLGNANSLTVMPKARRHALQAITLGERAAGNAQLAWVAMLYDWDWKLAADGFRHAVSSAQRWPEATQDQSPVESWARIGEAMMFCAKGRWLHCEKRLRAGVWADPWYPRATYGLKSPVRSALPFYAELLARMRRYDDAIEVAEWVLSNEGAENAASTALWMAHWWRGDVDRALAVRARFERRTVPRGATHDAGDFDRSLRSLLQSETRRRAQAYVSPTWIASLHAALGEGDLAFRWLGVALRERDSQLILAFNMNPAFDTLRDDPRFNGMAQQVGVVVVPAPARRVSRKIPWD